MISSFETWSSGLRSFAPLLSSETSCMPDRPWSVAPLVKLNRIVSRLSSEWWAVRMKSAFFSLYNLRKNVYLWSRPVSSRDFLCVLAIWAMLKCVQGHSRLCFFAKSLTNSVSRSASTPRSVWFRWATMMLSFGLNFVRISRRKTESDPPDTPIIKVSPPFKCLLRVSSVFCSGFLWRFRGIFGEL